MGHSFDAIYRLIVQGKIHGQTWQNVFWFRTKEGTPSVNLQEDTDNLISQFDLLMKSLYLGMMSSDSKLELVTATVMEPNNTAQTIKSYINQNGAVASEALPSYCAAVISWYTSNNGRSAHGRTYITGVPEIGATQSFFDTPHQTRISNFVTQWLGTFGINGSSSRFRFVVYSKKIGVTKVMTVPPRLAYSPLAGNPVTRAAINTTIYTQRHRLLGKGV